MKKKCKQEKKETNKIYYVQEHKYFVIVSFVESKFKLIIKN